MKIRIIMIERNFKNIHLLTIIPALLAIMILLPGCMDNDVSERKEAEGIPVRISAQMADMIHTRGYQEEGPVTEGNYYLSFPDTQNTYSQVADVNFSVPGVTKGIGIVTVPVDQELIWNDVGGGNLPYFYLDNVSPSFSQNLSDPMTVVFGEDNNPFVAGIFDKEKGTNDLLWSSVQVARKSGNDSGSTINFDLHHNMARLVVQITVDAENEGLEGDLSLDGATVQITNLIHVPYSYNRIDGTLSFDDNPDYTALYLVNENIGWASKQTDVGNPNITVYTTQDFVLPPQTLKTDAERPRLIITLQSGKVFSGVIPYAMTVIDSQYPETEGGGYPMALSFLKEHILNIRTLVSQEPPTLSFMPVQVVNWVDKGEFSLDSHQAGIYTADEFYKLIRYYQEGDKKVVDYQFQRYGSYDSDTNKWNFTLWNSITLDYDSIKGKMIPQANIEAYPNFNFTFNGYGVYVQQGNATPQSVTPQQLYDIVTGTGSL